MSHKAELTRTPDESGIDIAWRKAGRLVRRLALPLLFAAALLLINSALFTRPITEHSDFAANSIQIQHAKVFQEMLGNYSRWHFHHPGPAFFYLLAAGEVLFHDALHLVPASYNAQVISLFLINVCFIAASFELFRQHTPSPLFAPAAFAALVLFVSVVNRTVTTSALVSLWMPHVFLFWFVLFLVACASVAAGRNEHLPVAAVTGGFLAHAHVAQALFVGVLGGTALGVVLWRARRSGGDAQLARRCARALLTSVFIGLIFAFPIVAELFVDKPNNLQALASYEATYHGKLYSWSAAARYYFSYVAHIRNPEEVAPGGSAEGFNWIDAVRARPDVMAYWAIFGVLAVIAVWAVARKKVRAPAFLGYLAGELIIVSLLFLFWGTRISGPLYNFNGFFIYSLQFVALLIAASIVCSLIPSGYARVIGGALLAATAVALWMDQPHFQNNYPGSDEVRRIVAALPPDRRLTQIAFDPPEWPVAVGVASQMLREDRQFCVAPDWAFMFGAYSICRGAPAERITIANGPARCVGRCSILYNSREVSAQLSPAAGAGAGEPTYSPPGPAGPGEVSMTPSSGRGPGGTFRLRVASADSLRAFRLLFNDRIEGRQACFVIWDFDAKSLYLVSDSGSGAVGSAAPGSSAVLRNGQCSLDASASSILRSGQTLEFTLGLSFARAFRGGRNIYFLPEYRDAQSDWKGVGAWEVTGN